MDGGLFILIGAAVGVFLFFPSAPSRPACASPGTWTERTTSTAAVIWTVQELLTAT